ELSDLDDMIEERFTQHQQAAVIRSMPGFGPLLGAELIAATNGGLDSFHSADRLAAVAGLAPVPRDSGRISGNLKRPRRCNRRLLRACYLASHIASRTDTASRILLRPQTRPRETPPPSRAGTCPPPPQRH